MPRRWDRWRYTGRVFLSLYGPVERDRRLILLCRRRTRFRLILVVVVVVFAGDAAQFGNVDYSDVVSLKGPPINHLLSPLDPIYWGSILLQSLEAM